MNSRIEINSNICHGKPVIKGTRVMVSTILGALGAGDSIEDVLANYPTITREDILAAFTYASQLSQFETSAYEVA